MGDRLTTARRSWLQRLDARAFLDFDVWEFSWRSLWREYGRLFFRQIMLRYPLRTWRGLQQYRFQIRPARQGNIAPVRTDGTAALPDTLPDGKWLVGMGFCQKPLIPPCPAGRFNHRCSWLEQPHEPACPAACRACVIREIAEKSLTAGATFYIMTSARDIAFDLLLPNLTASAWTGIILSICPYSIPPITLAMSICGLTGYAVGYEQGNCRDYEAWSAADDGDKPEQTYLSPFLHQRLLSVLAKATIERQRQGYPVPVRYQRKGNFYDPQADRPADCEKTINPQSTDTLRDQRASSPANC